MLKDKKITLSMALLTDILFVIYLITCCMEIGSLNKYIQNAAYLGFIACVVLELKGNLRFRENTIRWVAFLVFAGASLLWTSNLSMSLMMLRIMLKVYVLMAFAIMYYAERGKFERVLRLIYISLILSNIYALIYTTAEDWVSASIGKNLGIDTVRLTLHFAMTTCIAWFFFVRTKKWIHIPIGILFLITSLLTGKRTGILFVAVTILLASILGQKGFFRKLLKVGGAVVALGILGYLVLTIPALYNTIGVRIVGFVDTLFGEGTSDASTVERMGIMTHAVNLFLDNPIFGSGLNGLRHYLQSLNFGHVTYAHNNYLEILSGLGVVGCFLFYWNPLIALVRGIRLQKRRSNQNAVFLMGFLIAWLVCDFVQVTYESYYEMVVLALVCACMGWEYRHSMKEVSQTEEVK